MIPGMYGNGMGMPNMGMNMGMPNMGMNMGMPNMGVMDMNMGMMPNMGMNMGMPNMGFMDMNMGMMGMQNVNMQGMNVGGNQNWMQGYNTNNNAVNNNSFSQKKISCMFKSTTGQQPIMILMDHGKTVNDLVKTYFARVGQPDLINTKDAICLLYNATKINFNSTQKIEDFFGSNSNPQILVNDVNNLIGALKKLN